MVTVEMLHDQGSSHSISCVKLTPKNNQNNSGQRRRADTYSSSKLGYQRGPQYN